MENKSLDNLIAIKIAHFLITNEKQWPKDSGPLFTNIMSKLKKWLSSAPGYNKAINPSNAGRELLADPNIPAGAFTQWSITNKQFLPSMRHSVMNKTVKEETGVAVIGTTSGAQNDPNGEPPAKKSNVLRRQQKMIPFKDWVANKGKNDTNS